MTATVRQILDALRTVGVAAWGLGVEIDPRVVRVTHVLGHPVDAGWGGDAAQGLWRLPEGVATPYLGLVDGIAARGWTALAAWIEGGVRPVEVQRWPRFVEYRVRLAGRYLASGARWTTGDADRLAGSRLDHAAVGELALALAVLRRWVAPTRPWGLRDMIAEHLERVGREATGRGAGGRRVPIVDPIPPGYVAAFGTADE